MELYGEIEKRGVRRDGKKLRLGEEGDQKVGVLKYKEGSERRIVEEEG